MKGGPEMKIEMIQDEFDKYFARAALGCQVNSALPEGDNRRGSLPSATLKAPETSTSASMRRTASCKYPSRRRKSRDKSASPRNASPSPKQRPGSFSMEGGSLIPGDSYVHEMTLRAPSPGVKCHSAPHSRSSSWKKSRRPRMNQDQEPDSDRMDSRPRTGSVPLEDTISKLETLKILQNESIHPVRNFATSPRGLINRGDSFKRRSNQSMASDAGSCGSGPRNESTGTPERDSNTRSRINSSNSQASSSSNPIYKVIVMGQHGTGKTALIQQFMTSDYMGATDTSFDDEGEVTVSVLLDGEETTLDFIDMPHHQRVKKYSESDAYIIVYSITDRNTFQHAVDTVNTIRKEDNRRVALIMVANKSDLVRTRQVSEEEAKEFCMMNECKYIETSAVLNHKIDELLVGIVTQIKLNPKRSERHKKRCEDKTQGGASCVTRSAKGFIERLFKRQSFISKSCDNLLVL